MGAVASGDGSVRASWRSVTAALAGVCLALVGCASTIGMGDARDGRADTNDDGAAGADAITIDANEDGAADADTITIDAIDAAMTDVIAPVDVAPPDVLRCPPPRTECGGTCVDDTDRNPDRCGAACVVCGTPPGAARMCEGGRCGFRCAADRADCDGDAANGCEVAPATDAAHCGACGTRCVAPMDGMATCAGGVCGFRCRDGFRVDGARCVRIVPRPLRPPSTFHVTTRRPRFRWIAPAGYDRFRVEACADRFCRTVHATMDVPGTDSEARPTTLLPPGVVFWRVQGLVAGAVVAASATWQFTTPVIDRPVDSYWGAVFDANGDGYADVAASGCEPTGALCVGYARVYYGGRSGLSPASVREWTEGRADQFAAGVHHAGDVDGDGYSDLAVGTSSWLAIYAGSPAGLDPGRPIVFRRRYIIGGANFRAIAALGDVNDDGYGDLAVRREDNVVAILAGAPPGAALETPLVELSVSGGEQSVGALGDVNGDGRPDLAYGEIFTGRRVRVHLGRAGGTYAATPDVEWRGTEDGYATNIVGIGDVNGDGYPDVGVSTVFADAYVYLGGATLPRGATARLRPTMARDGLHRASISGVGDVDRDGYDDVVVSAVADTIASLYRGGDTFAETPALTWQRAMWDPRVAGYSWVNVRGGGDTNGDGLPDVVLGHGRNAEVLVYHGRMGAIAREPDVVLRGTPRFGGALAQ